MTTALTILLTAALVDAVLLYVWRNRRRPVARGAAHAWPIGGAL